LKKEITFINMGLVMALHLVMVIAAAPAMRLERGQAVRKEKELGLVMATAREKVTEKARV
jgi:hypothetical protein